MSENENDIIVKITARKKNKGIAFNIEYPKEMNKREVENILDEIIQGIYKWKDKHFFHPYELKEKKE